MGAAPQGEEREKIKRGEREGERERERERESPKIVQPQSQCS